MDNLDFVFEEVTLETEYVLKNLLEYYLYDFNVFYEDDLRDNGRFEFIKTSDYVSKENYKAYFIKVNEHHAGFVLINDQVDFAKQPAMRIEEFWVFPKYRKGLFAFKILDSLFSKYTIPKEFIILKDNDRYLKVVEYLVNKHYTVIDSREIIKWDDVEFKEYVVL